MVEKEERERRDREKVIDLLMAISIQLGAILVALGVIISKLTNL